MEKFIERGTEYPLDQGRLTLYETNCSCKDIQFHFDEYVMTVMLSGHKTIVSRNLKFEFFPGTYFIPEKGVINKVSIPNASLDNPTKCLVLHIQPSFIKSVYEEVLHENHESEVLYSKESKADNSYYISSDQLLIQTFCRLYRLQLKDHSPCKKLIEELLLKEILYRTFHTEGIKLLLKNLEKSVANDRIYTVVRYIEKNIGEKITTSELASIAGMGQTTFFKKFKNSIGLSPMDYINSERIRKSKIMLQKNKTSLQEIAFLCGFNSYEYFCSSFKKLEGMKPTQYKKMEKFV